MFLAYLADLHFGSINPNKELKDLNEIFINNIVKELNKDLSAIFILGDYFDRKINLTENSSIAAVKFMNFLCKYCNKNNIQLRLIKGTKTHDFNQLENFRYLETYYPVFRIINTITVEKLLLDNQEYKILYVPEEYMEDQEEYYKEYKKDNYDLILGHGQWDLFSFKNQIEESERNISGSPVLKYNEWKNSVNYNIIFGHIHTYNHHGKLYYPGSFERWCFGEEASKGILIQELDKEKDINEIQFIENYLAEVYETKSLSKMIKNIKKDKRDIESISKEIEKCLKKVKNNDKVRINVDIDVNLSDMRVLKETFSESTNLKLEVNNLSKKINKDNQEDDEEYLLSNNASKNIKLFIKNKFNKEIDEELIDELSLTE